MENKFIKIPREIIYDTGMDIRRVLIFSYLCCRRSLDNTVAFSTTELCRWSGIKPNYREGKINQKYYEILSILSHYGYFDHFPDFKKMVDEKKNSTEYRLLQLNTEKFDMISNFGVIYFDELHKILNFKVELNNVDIDLSRISHSSILLVLAYLRLNMYKGFDKPQCCYRLYTTISDDTGISNKYIGKIVEVLSMLDIISYGQLNRIAYVDENGHKKYATNPKIFANRYRFTKDDYGNEIIDRSYNCDLEIQKQLELLEKGGVPINKKST